MALTAARAASVAARAAMAVLFVAGVAALLLAQEARDGGLPKLAGAGLIIVGSGSMEPALPVGSLALVVERGSYDVGDVIVFRSDGSLVAHRVVAFGEGGALATRGDANNVDDAHPVAPEDVEGAVVALAPGVGAALESIKSPVGATVAFVVALGLAAAFVVGGRKKKERSET